MARKSGARLPENRSRLMLDGRFDPGFEHLFRSTDPAAERRAIRIAIVLGALPFATLALLTAVL
ncbi:MAG: hypothetical protein HZT43_04830 [Exiguobacterium profundum]|nr:MAG: hypothetical protein HZT43_04830 [Exiguobacterium profundum]